MPSPDERTASLAGCSSQPNSFQHGPRGRNRKGTSTAVLAAVRHCGCRAGGPISNCLGPPLFGPKSSHWKQTSYVDATTPPSAMAQAWHRQFLSNWLATGFLISDAKTSANALQQKPSQNKSQSLLHASPFARFCTKSPAWANVFCKFTLPG